jgi:hypothetical protein
MVSRFTHSTELLVSPVTFEHGGGMLLQPERPDETACACVIVCASCWLFVNVVLSAFWPQWPDAYVQEPSCTVASGL